MKFSFGYQAQFAGVKMIFEVILLVLSAVSVTLSQQMMCTYVKNDKYQCDMFIYNPDGLNNSVVIGGNHLTTSINSGGLVVYGTLTDSSVLRVNANAGTTKNVPSAICSQFRNVEWLTFFQVNVEIMSIRNCSKVTIIDLSYNLVKEMPSDLCLNQPNLTTLYLSFNQISTIPVDALKSCFKLDTFNVDNNQLSEISPILFDDKPALKIVSFANNKKITTVPDYAFRGAYKLERIMLSNCAINNVSATAFYGLLKLKFLTLSHNSLKTINPEWFNDLAGLTTLDVSYNPLVTISSTSFKNLISLEVLDLSSSGISTLNPEWFSKLTKLKKLYLISNNITEIPPGVFSSCSQIQQIDFAFNKLKRIDSKPFSPLGLQSLNLIDAAYNQITAVEKMLFDTPSKLNIVSFTGNVCQSKTIYGFFESKDVNMGYYQTCFNNYVNGL